MIARLSPRILGLAPLVLSGLPVAALAVVDAGTQVDYVIVTAQKASEPLQAVPISVSVLGGQALTDRNINDYDDLARSIPNVSVTNFGGPGQSNIEIRGIRSQAGSATTAIYLDDVPIEVINVYATGASEPKFFDIDHLEVLRGPQGTIYGSGSMGGMLHFVSVRPDLQMFSGNAQIEVSDRRRGGANEQVSGVLNLPLSQGAAALRLGLLQQYDSGWISRVDTSGNLVASHVNDEHSGVLRAALLFKPSPSVTIAPAVLVQRVATGGSPLWGADLGLYQSPTLVAEKAGDDMGMGSLTANVGLAWGDLTSVTGFFGRRDNRLIDGTSYDSGYIASLFDTPASQGGLGLGHGGSFAALPAPSRFDTTVHRFLQELRFASRPGAPGDALAWIFGAYYGRTRTELVDDEHIPGFSTTFQRVFDQPPAALLGAGAFAEDLVYDAGNVFRSEEEALFGQVAYRVAPPLKLTLGLRAEHAGSSLAFDTAGFLSAGTPHSNQSLGGRATSPRAAISFDLAPEFLLYASAAKGFRIGGANRPMPASLCGTTGPTGYQADTLWSYELGAKRQFLGHALSLSAALFDIQWRNMQQDIIVNSCGFDYKANVGDARSRGAEFEMNWQATANWQFGATGNATGARMTEGVAALGVQKGDLIPGVPRWMLALDAKYEISLEAGRIHARLDGQWTGSSQGAIAHGDPDFHRPGYFTMGASAGLSRRDADFALFVANLLDQHRILQRPSVAGVEYASTVRPLTVGVRSTFDF